MLKNIIPSNVFTHVKKITRETGVLKRYTETSRRSILYLRQTGKTFRTDGNTERKWLSCTVFFVLRSSLKTKLLLTPVNKKRQNFRRYDTLFIFLSIFVYWDNWGSNIDRRSVDSQYTHSVVGPFLVPFFGSTLVRSDQV